MWLFSSPPFCMSNLVCVLLVSLCMPRFVCSSFPSLGSPTYPFLSNYWIVSSLLNQSEGTLPRHIFTVYKKSIPEKWCTSFSATIHSVFQFQGQSWVELHDRPTVLKWSKKKKKSAHTQKNITLDNVTHTHTHTHTSPLLRSHYPQTHSWSSSLEYWDERSVPSYPSSCPSWLHQEATWGDWLMSSLFTQEHVIRYTRWDQGLSPHVSQNLSPLWSEVRLYF